MDTSGPLVSRPPGAVPDSVIAAAPVDVLAERIDPRVVDTLARWRDVDPHSLSSIAPVLVTNAGQPAVDNVGYLSALHGFVAENITFHSLSQSHVVDMPAATNVPALDLVVDGHPVQIKEGTSAYEQVHHALERYPDVSTFAVGPDTAQRLNLEGIAAFGVPGLEPEHISSITTESLQGLDALESSGAVHVPILTTVFSLCRYWERYDAGRIDGRTATNYAATDIGAQAIASALGLKIAAISVVASGGFALAVVPLTAGAILGALGLRYLVNQRRSAHMAHLVSELSMTREACEHSAEIATEISRSYLERRLNDLNADTAAKLEFINRQAQSAVETWATETCNEVFELCQSLLLCIPLVARADFEIALEASNSTGNRVARVAALYDCLKRGFRLAGEPSQELLIRTAHTAERCMASRRQLDDRRAELHAEADALISNVKRTLSIEVAAEYLLLLERLAIITAPLIPIAAQMRAEAEKLGTDLAKFQAMNET